MTLTLLDSIKKTLTSSDASYFDFLKDYTPSLTLVSEVIRLELMNLRHSIAHTKTRAEVSGGGRKPWKQKGTGRARHGSTRSPIWVGGGTTFGPRNERNWHRKINHSARVSALKSILTDRINESKLVITNNLKQEKTKDAQDLIAVFRKENPKAKIAIFYTSADKDNLNGFRNIVGVDLINVINLSLNRMSLSSVYLFTEDSAKFLSDRLSK
jgi:large subunit ribosomal protein L4